MAAKIRPKKAPPFEFVLDLLARKRPTTKAMFGAVAVYIGDRIIFILRDRESHPRDNGVWIATTSEHHASLHADFPSMRSIGIFSEDGQPSGWQTLPADAADFESSVERACELVLKGDPRIGKTPKARAAKKTKAKKR